jgi:hypothetical protein
MAEAKHSPVGRPTIVGVLNRRNVKSSMLISVLAKFRDINEFRRAGGRLAKSLRLAFDLGEGNEYGSDTRARLLGALNGICGRLGIPVEFALSDFPEYFDGGVTEPFGRPLIDASSMRAAIYLEQIREQSVKWS